MTEEVRKALEDKYNFLVSRAKLIEKEFIEQFSEDLVDSSLCSFSQFLEYLNGCTLGNLGIHNLSESNRYGRYTIDREDYEKNGRGKPFPEYVPDLGLINYLTDTFQNIIGDISIKNIGDSASQEHMTNYGFCITVRFPEVTITNEMNRSHKIKELYVRNWIGLGGVMLGAFRMVRTEFTKEEFLSDYSHSHLPGINSIFERPCLGTGPIERTTENLRRNYDINLWGLYVYELSKYVEVESLQGVPYRRIDSIGKGSIAAVDPWTYTPASVGPRYGLPSKIVEDFANYFLRSGQMKFSYSNGEFGLGESQQSFWIKVSNAFIKWWNAIPRKFGLTQLLNCRTLREYIVSEGIVYYKDTLGTLAKYERDKNRVLFKFKGQDMKWIISDLGEAGTSTYLVTPEIYQFILTKALLLINFNYGREERKPEKSENSGEESGESTSETTQRCLYL